MSTELSIVLPTYKEKDNLRILIPQIETEFRGTSFEIIVVDDGSNDGTRELIQELEDTYHNVTLIERQGLLGIGSALRDGYNAARGTYILSSDADLSFVPSDMMKLYEIIRTGPDMVLGNKIPVADKLRETKLITQHMKLPIGTLCNWIVRTVSNTQRLKEYNTNFRIMSASLWKTLETREDRNFFLFETILKASQKKAWIVEVPVSFLPRKFGSSKLNFLSQAPGYFLTLVRTTWFNRSR